MTAFSSSPRFVEHLTGPQHPERPDRIRAIAKVVRDAGLTASPNPFPGFELDFGAMPRAAGNLLELSEPVPADEKWLALVHPRQYIENVRDTCASGGGILDDGDTPVSAKSFDIALTALGALLDCCDAVVSEKVKRAF